MIQKLVMVYSLLFTPLILVNTYQLKKLKKLSKNSQELAFISQKVKKFCSLEEENNKIKEKYLEASKTYLYDHLENLNLSEENIQLVETPGEKTKFYTDKQEALAKPINVDLTDIRQILDCVERSEAKGKPHLFFSNFSLLKNSDPENTTYKLSFKIIKRDYQK